MMTLLYGSVTFRLYPPESSVPLAHASESLRDCGAVAVGSCLCSRWVDKVAEQMAIASNLRVVPSGSWGGVTVAAESDVPCACAAFQDRIGGVYGEG